MVLGPTEIRGLCFRPPMRESRAQLPSGAYTCATLHTPHSGLSMDTQAQATALKPHDDGPLMLSAIRGRSDPTEDVMMMETGPPPVTLCFIPRWWLSPSTELPRTNRGAYVSGWTPATPPSPQTSSPPSLHPPTNTNLWNMELPTLAPTVPAKLFWPLVKGLGN